MSQPGGAAAAERGSERECRDLTGSIEGDIRAAAEARCDGAHLGVCEDAAGEPKKPSPAQRSGASEGRLPAAWLLDVGLAARQGSQSPAEGVGTSGGGEGCDTDEGTSAGRIGNKRALEGTPEEEGSEAEGAPSSGSGRRDGARGGRAKRPRLVWTMELNKRFLDAVMHLGISQAVPKAILALMNVEGMTRENVASHLQKYRIWLKRLAGFPPGARVAPEVLQQVAEQHAHQPLLYTNFSAQALTCPPGHFGAACFPLPDASSTPEARLAAAPLTSVGNGAAHRAGYTYPSTWRGTLPQIAPLSGVPSGAAAPVLGLPQLGFMGAPRATGPGPHAPGGWVWGVASGDVPPALAQAAQPPLPAPGLQGAPGLASDGRANGGGAAAGQAPPWGCWAAPQASQGQPAAPPCSEAAAVEAAGLALAQGWRQAGRAPAAPPAASGAPASC